MTRQEKRMRARSAAAQQAENYKVNKIIRDLEKQYAQALKENQSLREELLKLKQELKSTRSALKTTKISHANLRAATAKITSSFHLKTISSKTDSFTRTSNVKIQPARRTRLQWLEENKINFINNFIERLKNNFPNAGASNNDFEVLRNTMRQLDAATIDEVLQNLDEDTRTMYYESFSLIFEEAGNPLTLRLIFNAFAVDMANTLIQEIITE